MENCACLTLFVGHKYLCQADYSQVVMLWHDKNKVRGLFIFLFCCSFESYTYCYGLCSKWVHYRWLSISIFFKKRFVLVRGILLSLLNECHICFPWSFLKVSLSENHSGESNTRCHFVFDTQSSFTQTHLWIYIDNVGYGQGFNLGDCVSAFCIVRCYRRMQAYLLLDTRDG